MEEVGDRIEARTCLCRERGIVKEEEEEEDDEGRRLIGCLRGSLLAERQAARAAKQEAQLMGKRLAALEGRLREEIESRDKAEKKLKFLEKKLGCFEPSPLMERDQGGNPLGALKVLTDHHPLPASEAQEANSREGSPSPSPPP